MLKDMPFGAVARGIDVVVMVIVTEEDFDDTMCVVLEPSAVDTFGEVAYFMGDDWERIDG